MGKTVIILLCSLILFGTPALAIEIDNPLEADSIEELMEGIITFIFWVAVALAPLMVLIGAFYFITSGGDPSRIQTGRNIIWYTVVGLVIVFLSRGLISAIKMILNTT
ncbi:hypothetical protein ACFL06_01725 [Patescibacteria group bacterium]